MLKNIKAIFTVEKSVKEEILKTFSYKKENSLDNLEIYVLKRKTENIEEETSLFFYTKKENLKKMIKFSKENYLIEKFVLIGNSEILRNQDIEESDIIIPNTFVDRDGKNPIFLEYAIGANYDLNKFGLLLSGVCRDSNEAEIKNDEDFRADIVDKDSYTFLKQLKNDDLEKVVIIRNCIKKDSKFIDYDNLVNILDIVI